MKEGRSRSKKSSAKPKESFGKRKRQSDDVSMVADSAAIYTTSRQKPATFRITRAGKQREYKIETGYGYFISSFQRATNIKQLSEVVDTGITSKEIEPVIQYLGFKVPEIAKAAAVSASTVSRWEPETSIGVAGTSQFFKIDEIIKKGVDLFGGLEEFKTWLETPNIALGNQVPAKILTSQIGVGLVDEALDALHFGTVI